MSRVSSSIPMVARVSPGTIRGRGPTLGSRLLANPAVRMTPAENGRNAKPAFSGENPRIVCMYRLRNRNIPNRPIPLISDTR